MKGLFLIAAVVLACSLKDCTAVDKTILVKMHFAVSWREMCLLEKYLKENVAKQIVTDKTGKTLDTDRLVFDKFKDHCSKESADHAVVEMYVSKSKTDMNVDVEMTKKLYKVLSYLYEQKQERYLGNLFVGKITDVTVTGKDAPPPSTAYTEIERTYIGIGVACAILVLIIIILVAISCYKNRNKTKEDRYSNRAAYQAENETVRKYPSAQAENAAYEDERNGAQKSDYRLSTRF